MAANRPAATAVPANSRRALSRVSFTVSLLSWGFLESTRVGGLDAAPRGSIPRQIGWALVRIAD
jgi:hypothetical protein